MPVRGVTSLDNVLYVLLGFKSSEKLNSVMDWYRLQQGSVFPGLQELNHACVLLSRLVGVLWTSRRQGKDQEKVKVRLELLRSQTKAEESSYMRGIQNR